MVPEGLQPLCRIVHDRTQARNDFEDYGQGSSVLLFWLIFLIVDLSCTSRMRVFYWQMIAIRSHRGLAKRRVLMALRMIFLPLVTSE